jgi:hypothetical protein
VKKGKNFSCNNVGDKRREADFYSTPYSLTRLFLETGALHPECATLEPAAGDGAITKVLAEYGFCNVRATDIQTGVDFLTCHTPVQQLVTNPPYSLAYEFIQHAKEVATERFALLLPLSYLHGKARYDNIWLDKQYPLTSVYVFTRYPHLGEQMREDGKCKTGMMVYAWFVWEKGATLAAPQIYWLDNDAYIVRGKE